MTPNQTVEQTANSDFLFTVLMRLQPQPCSHLPLPGRCSPRRYARKSTVEAAYREQIARLREIAYDHKARWNTTLEGCEADRSLFSAPEILQAAVEPTRNSFLMVGGRKFDFRSDTFFVDTFGASNVSRHWYTLPDGSKISGESYHTRVTNRDGHEVSVVLILDLQKMHKDTR